MSTWKKKPWWCFWCLESLHAATRVDHDGWAFCGRSCVEAYEHNAKAGDDDEA